MDLGLGGWHKLVCDWIKMATQVGGVDEDGEGSVVFDDWAQVSRGRRSGRSRRDEANQNSKRSLEENGSEGDRRVVRDKVMREGYKMILKFGKEGEHVNLSPITLSRELRKKLGEVEMAKILRDGNLLTMCKTEEWKNKALLIVSICKKVVNESRVLDAKKVAKGVVTGFPVDEDMERIKRSISGGEVSRAKRLQKAINGDRVDSLSVLLESEGPALPEKVKIGSMSFPVRPYIPPPASLLYSKCQRYGHIAVACKGKQRCPKCGGEHRSEESRDEGQDKCCNCGGQHRVTLGGCEVRKRAVEIEQVKAVNNISYAEAVKRVQDQREKEDTRKMNLIPRTEKDRTEETNTALAVDKRIRH